MHDGNIDLPFTRTGCRGGGRKATNHSLIVVSRHGDCAKNYADGLSITGVPDFMRSASYCQEILRGGSRQHAYIPKVAGPRARKSPDTRKRSNSAAWAATVAQQKFTAGAVMACRPLLAAS